MQNSKFIFFSFNSTLGDEPGSSKQNKQISTPVKKRKIRHEIDPSEKQRKFKRHFRKEWIENEEFIGKSWF